MADGAVQAVIQLLVPFVVGEVSLIAGHGLPEDIRAIKRDLDTISASLKTADKIAEEDVNVRQRVKEVREYAYDIEDVIEEYHFQQKESALGKAKQILLRRRQDIAESIRNLRQRATNIISIRDFCRVDCNVVELGSQDGIGETSPFLVEECQLVGAQVPKGQIIDLLRLQEMTLRRETVAVLGMRGIGKTTVVLSVYNDTLVKEFFPIRAWIAASQTCSFTEVLRSMMKQFCEAAQEIARLKRACLINQFQKSDIELDNLDINSMEEISLQKLIRQFLEEKRYMVVFDDVQEGRDLANYVQNVLPPTSNTGSKILVTTRYENVACAWLQGSSHDPLKLKPLTREDAWELFCKRTFQRDRGRCPSLLQSVARQIVDRCQGLPQAIVAVSSFLSTRQNDLGEWKRVYHNLRIYLEKSPSLRKIHRILVRDYHNLEYYLKPCLLYFGLFPKGYALDRMRLFRLWIAEGFISERGCLTQEEVAEEYLHELTNMCLVEVVHTDPTGKPKSLRVHDFLHEIILCKLEELSFCQILARNNRIPAGSPRRLSLHKDPGTEADQVLENIARSDKSNIRSLFLIDQKEEIFPKVLNKAFLKTVHLLKVLDLSNAPIDSIPNEVGYLLNLRFLSLRNTGVRKLTSFIGKLEDLQTLDLKQTPIQELPTEINTLQKLRHLLACQYEYHPDFSYHTMKVGGPKIPQGALGNFRELQKLAFVDVTHNCHKAGIIKELQYLTQLRKLGIVNLRQSVDMDSLSLAIQGMKCLQTLSVFAKDKCETIGFLHYVKSPPPTLKRLYLSGRLKSLPGCILQLQSLVKLRLRWSQLQHDLLDILRELPNLLELQLLEAYAGTTLQIGNTGFQKLKVLHLLDLHNLRSLHIRKLALPLLEEMSIGESPNLSMPTGIQYLSKLQRLNFYSMTESFNRNVQQGGKYSSIIRHVPGVFFHNKCEGYWKAVEL